MTDPRLTVDQINSDQLDQLYDRLDRARDAAALHRQELITTAELYAVIEAGPAATKATEPAGCPVDHCDPDHCGVHTPGGCGWRDATPNPAAVVTGLTKAVKRAAMSQQSDFVLSIEPGVDRQTAAVLAALHHSAEADVSRVIALYEQWVKAGPPPLGTSVSRWWDARLVELHEAILPTADQTKEQPCTAASPPQKSPAPSPPEATPTP